jgi:hypothetical protein
VASTVETPHEMELFPVGHASEAEGGALLGEHLVGDGSRKVPARPVPEDRDSIRSRLLSLPLLGQPPIFGSHCL